MDAPPPSIPGFPQAAPPPIPAADVDVDDNATLPVDLLLEVAARSDVVSVVRCAAANKPLRRAILDQGFRRLISNRAAATGGFDRALLRGVSYLLVLEDSEAGRPVRVVQAIPTTEPSLVRFDESLVFEPVASRDGLVVLRRLRPEIFRQPLEEGPPGSALRVVNSFTGDVSVLPSVSIRDYHKHALLNVEDNGRSFELLVADERLRTQIYSSRDGAWSPVRAIHLQRGSRPFEDSCPLVIGRTVHWLCSPQPLPLGPVRRPDPYIVAMDADTTQATAIDLPRGCTSRMPASVSNRGLLLAATVDGKLLVVVAETQVISMWTLSPPTEEGQSLQARWRRQVLIDKQVWDVHNSLQFEGFGQRSGTVVLNTGNGSTLQPKRLILLNLATKQAHVVFYRTQRAYISQVCLHEINLSTLLQAMKQLT